MLFGLKQFAEMPSEPEPELLLLLGAWMTSLAVVEEGFAAAAVMLDDGVGCQWWRWGMALTVVVMREMVVRLSKENILQTQLPIVECRIDNAVQLAC